MPDIFGRLGIALGLGLLVGLQRQRTDPHLAGFRTFPLVTLLGALSGLLAQPMGGWIVAVALGGVALVIVGGSRALPRAVEEQHGLTTAVALLLMLVVGAYTMAGSTAIAIAVGGAVAVLLHLKPQMHSLAAQIGDRDFTAIMQFALISMVVLPVLPNRYLGPFGVLNPFKIWTMVVLIVGLSLAAYVLYKFLGARAGAWAGGVLGGLISSTATTVSTARRTRQTPESTPVAAFVILAASAIVFARITILVGATAPALLPVAVGPFALMFVALGFIGWWNLERHGDRSSTMPEPENPTELKTALFFGVLYALVLLATAAARGYAGELGLFAVAVLSGLTDMDAITLSVTQLVVAGEVSPGTAWRLILVAAISNLVFKAGTVAVLGDARLFRRVAVGFGTAAAIGAGLIAFGPG